jgi:hypothetical protein
VLAKGKRFRIFLEGLRAAPPASSADEAFNLLTQTLNAVEDEFSGVANRPENWRTDGRMYPPQADSLVKNPENPDVRKYRSKGHSTYVGANGSLRIETLDAEILIDKPGQDGRTTHQPAKPKSRT